MTVLYAPCWRDVRLGGVGGAFDEVEHADGGLAHDVVLVVLVLVVHLQESARQRESKSVREHQSESVRQSQRAPERESVRHTA